MRRCDRWSDCSPRACQRRSHQRGAWLGWESAALIKAHLDAISTAVGNASSVAALGTDIDGFIKPTLAGFEKAEDFAKLETWVRKAGQNDPEAILHGNSERVISAAFTGR
jgi:hypothetical protein